LRETIYLLAYLLIYVPLYVLDVLMYCWHSTQPQETTP